MNDHVVRETFDDEPWMLGGLEMDLVKNPDFYLRTTLRYRLFFEFMRLSPTYWAAHKYCSGHDGGLSKEEESKMPDYFQRVVMNYERGFGDVFSMPFINWWHTVGADYYGIPLIDYRPSILGRIDYEEEDSFSEMMAIQSLIMYGKRLGKASGSPEHLLVSIPLFGSRREIVKFIDDYLKEEGLDIVSKQQVTPILTGGRFVHDALSKNLRLLWLRAEHQHLALWRLGVMAKISKKHQNLDIGIKSVKQARVTIETAALANITKSMLTKSFYIVENSAIGVFPDSTVPENLPDVDFAAMREGVCRRKKSDLEFFKNNRKRF